MTSTTPPGGTFTLADDLILTRCHVAGWPACIRPASRPRRAIAVLREVVKLGITHIDISDYYGPM